MRLHSLHRLRRGARLAGLLAQRDDEPGGDGHRDPDAGPAVRAVHRDQRPELGACTSSSRKVAVTARADRRTCRTHQRLRSSIAYVDEPARRQAASTVRQPRDGACSGCEEAYHERGAELDLGGANIKLYASLEIALTDPNASGAVASCPRGRDTRSSASPPSRPSTRSCSASSAPSARWGSWRSCWWALSVLFMIVNTIRIAVYSRANEIEIMRLVGASDSFIRWPFILEGILCGLIGAVVTIVLVAVVWDPDPAGDGQRVPDADRGQHPVPGHAVGRPAGAWAWGSAPSAPGSACARTCRPPPEAAPGKRNVMRA